MTTILHTIAGDAYGICRIRIAWKPGKVFENICMGPMFKFRCARGHGRAIGRNGSRGAVDYKYRTSMVWVVDNIVSLPRERRLSAILFIQNLRIGTWGSETTAMALEYDAKGMPFRRLGPSGLRVPLFSLGGCTLSAHCPTNYLLKGSRCKGLPLGEL